MRHDAAETIAIRALGWIAARDELVGAFLTATGAEAGDLARRAGEPEFLGFILDFLLADEAALVAFCEDAEIPPEEPMRARAALPGGELPNWT